MAVELKPLVGREIDPWLGPVAELRIQVFRDYPYLYDGDAEYERDYLATYADSPSSLFVLALEGGQVVGAATGVPMVEADEAFQQPFLSSGMRLDKVFYFGESVLLPAWRGLGVGGRFFDAREHYARALGADLTCFCAVDRPVDDPRRPPGYQPLDAFWQRRGYQRRNDMRADYDWREVDHSAPSRHSMVFWLKHWGMQT